MDWFDTVNIALINPSELTDKARRIYNLYIEGKSQREIANLVGCSPINVYDTLMAISQGGRKVKRDELTARQQEVYDLKDSGKSWRGLAKELKISQGGVRSIYEQAKLKIDRQLRERSKDN